MSITVSILYHGRDGSARAFADEMVDRWRDQEAIDAHHASPMMAAIAGLRDKYDLHMEVRRFTDLDEPEGDDRFVRR